MSSRERMRSMPGDRARKERRHWTRWVLTAGSLLLTILVLEFLTPWFYSALEGRPFPREELVHQLAQQPLEWTQMGHEAVTRAPNYVTNKVIHPYIGFVADPERGNINPYGFHGPDPLESRKDDELRVALLGGSLALGNTGYLEAALGRTLNERSGSQTAAVRVFSLALDGYKQPQHLFALEYLLLAGADFDVVVNLDGFNEIALPFSENVVAGVHPIYPRSWQLFSRSMTSPEIAEKVVEFHRRKSDYEWWRRHFDFAVARHSNLLLLTWSALANWKMRLIRAADTELREILRDAPEQPRDVGPPASYPSREALFRDLVRVWRESSSLMSRLCAARGIAYFHFLQPNQYVNEAKPLSEWERTHATTPGPFRDAAELGYPLLIENGAYLKAAGVPFWDLTRLFSGIEETLYSDNCCHLNDEGNRILAERMASFIVANLPAVSKPQ